MHSTILRVVSATALLVLVTTAAHAQFVESPLDAMVGTPAQKTDLERGMVRQYENPCRDSGLYWLNRNGNWELTGDGMATLALEDFFRVTGADDDGRSMYRVLLLALGNTGRVPFVELTRMNRGCEPELSEVLEDAKGTLAEAYAETVRNGPWSDEAKVRFLQGMIDLDRNPCRSDVYYRRDATGWWLSQMQEGSVAIALYGDPPGLSRKQAKNEYDVPLRDLFCSN